MCDSDDDGAFCSNGPASERTGRWTPKEHHLFVEGLRLHGKLWKNIADMITTRSIVQIRTHAQKYFLKQGQKGLEDDYIARGGNNGDGSVHDHPYHTNINVISSNLNSSAPSPSVSGIIETPKRNKDGYNDGSANNSKRRNRCRSNSKNKNKGEDIFLLQQHQHQHLEQEKPHVAMDDGNIHFILLNSDSSRSQSEYGDDCSFTDSPSLSHPEFSGDILGISTHFPCDISGHANVSSINSSASSGSPTSISATAYHDNHFITIDRTSCVKIGEKVEDLSNHADYSDDISDGGDGGRKSDGSGSLGDTGFHRYRFGFGFDTGDEKPIKRRKRSCAIVDIFAAIEDCEYSSETPMVITQNPLDSYLDIVEPAGDEEHFYGMPISHRYF